MNATEKETLITNLNSALDELRPHLNVDGGDVNIESVTDDGEVLIRWLGNCEYCNMSRMTIKAGIEQTLKNKFPEIKSVTAINGMHA